VTVSPVFLLFTAPVSVTSVPNFTTGAEMASVTCGGAPRTVTVPFSARMEAVVVVIRAAVREGVRVALARLQDRGRERPSVRHDLVILRVGVPSR